MAAWLGRRLRRFRRDQDGSPTVETVMVLTPLLLAIFAVADLTIVYLSIESSQKAAQLGARLAVTRTPVHDQVPATNVLIPANGRAGDPCFSASGNDACRGYPGIVWRCDGASLSVDCNTAEFDVIVREIQRLYASVGREDVTIEYIYRRLGRANGPFEPEVRVTIAQRDYVRSVRSLMPFVNTVRAAVASNYAEDMRS